MYPPQPCVGNAAYISSVIDLSASRIAASTHRNVSSRYSNQFRLSPATCFLCIVIRIYVYTLYVYTYIGRISISMYLLNGTSFPNSPRLAFQPRFRSKLTRIESKRAYKIGTMIFPQAWERLGRDRERGFGHVSDNTIQSLAIAVRYQTGRREAVFA